MILIYFSFLVLSGINVYAQEQILIHKETTKITGTSWDYYRNQAPGNCKVDRCIYTLKENLNSHLITLSYGLMSQDGCGIMHGDTVYFRGNNWPLPENYFKKDRSSAHEYFKVKYAENILELKSSWFYCDLTDGCPVTRFAHLKSNLYYTENNFHSIKKIVSLEKEPKLLRTIHRKFTCEF